MKRRGFTLIEVIVTCAVLLVGVLVIVSTFTMNLRHSTTTRDSLLAHLVMENLVEEALAHPYGRPAPPNWNAEPVTFDLVVEGSRVQNSFRRTVKVDPNLGNGSVFGSRSGDKDYLLLEVRWTEPSDPGARASDKSLSVPLTVVRKL